MFPVWERRDREACEKGNMEAMKESEGIFVSLVHHSARPTSEFLWKLAHDTNRDPSHGWQRFEKLVLRAVESARNPLVPGMSLSVNLANAAEHAREGEERRLSGLRRDLDAFMIEVLKRLPQTVRGFKDGVRGCSRLFEPDGSKEKPIGRKGPLRLSFSRRQQMENICASPLVMDYLSNRFTCGLPNLRDTDGFLRNEEELRQLAHTSDDSVSPILCIDPTLWRWSQGGLWDEGSPALTLLPGAQFIIVGLLVIPRSYYRVPVMRMAMDFVVYVAMLVAFFRWVLLHEDGPVTIGESLFAVYIVVSIVYRRNYSSHYIVQVLLV